MFDVLAGTILFVLAVALSIWVRCKVENTLPICTLGIIVMLYFAGLFNNTSIGLYCLFCLFIFAIIYLWVRRKMLNKEKIFSLGAVYYWVMLLIAIFQNRYKYPHTWDELAQWAVSPKYLYMTDKFGAFAGSNCFYPDYPPASALFHYVWMQIGNSFEDHRLYISMAVLLSVFLIPFLSKFNIRNDIFKNVLACVGIYVSMFSFYSNAYTSLTVDCLLGVCFAYIIYLEYWEENVFVKRLGVILAVFVLTITKESGIIFSVIALIIIFAKELIEMKRDGIKKISVFYIILSLVSCLFSKLSWNFYCNVNSISGTWNHEISSDIIENLQEYQLTGFKNYFIALFKYDILEDTSQTVFHLGVFNVPCIVWIVLFIAAIVILWKKLDKQLKCLYAIFMTGLLLYIVAVSKLYLTSFGEGEVAHLSSFSRYLGTYLLAIYLCILFNFFASWGNEIYLYLLFILLPHIVVSNTFLYEINILNTKEEQEAYYDWEKFKNRMCKLNNYIEPGSIIHVFNGDIVGSNYALTPTFVASPIWQAEDFSWFRSFASSLDYQYVFFDTINGTIENDEFIELYSDIFNNSEPIMDNGIYQVYYLNDDPKLKFVSKLQ